MRLRYYKTMGQLHKKFGLRLKVLRTEAGYTQEQLAEVANISVDFISLIERGLNSPSFKTVEKLIKALEISPKDLFDFDD